MVCELVCSITIKFMKNFRLQFKILTERSSCTISCLRSVVYFIPKTLKYLQTFNPIKRDRAETRHFSMALEVETESLSDKKKLMLTN